MTRQKIRFAFWTITLWSIVVAIFVKSKKEGSEENIALDDTPKENVVKEKMSGNIRNSWIENELDIPFHE